MASIWSNRDLSGTRDAVLVNGLAALAGCATVVLAIILHPNDKAFCPALGAALSATGGLLVWSLTLAVRARWRGERSGWGWAVMVLGGLETVLLGGLACLIWFAVQFNIPWQEAWQEAWQWASETGMIMFLPVGAIACLAAVPVTWWRLRRAARQDAEAGIEGRSHWKRGLSWFCAVAALVATLLLLPGPLFLYCCWWKSEHGMGDNWQKRVVENTPVFVADPAAGALTLSSFPPAVGLYHCALASGRVSKHRLLAEVHSADPWKQWCAYEGLTLADVQAALAVADQIGQGGTSGTSPNLQMQAGKVMGEHGTAERIRYFLTQAATQSPPPLEFMHGLLYGLHDIPEILPELTSLCRKDPKNRQVALYALARALRPKDLPGFGAEFLADSDPVRRHQAMQAIPAIRDASARLAIIAAGLESPDPAVRQELRQWLPSAYLFFRDCRSSAPALVKRLVQALLPVLNDDDPGIRCAAACSLASLVDDHGSMQKTFNFFNSLHYDLLHGIPWQAKPLEPEMLEAVRAAAEKWLSRRE